MIQILLITIVAFCIAALFLSIGVIFKKRTPLKGSCGNVEQYRRDADGNAPSGCGGCDCHAQTDACAPSSH